MTRNRFFQAILFAICTCFTPVFAAAPAALRNKTIHVSYFVATPSKGDNGNEHVGSRTITRTIYVSSLGRAFVKKGGHRGTKRPQGSPLTGGPRRSRANLQV